MKRNMTKNSEETESTFISVLNSGTAAVACAIPALWLIYFEARCYEGVVILSHEKFGLRE